MKFKKLLLTLTVGLSTSLAQVLLNPLKSTAQPEYVDAYFYDMTPFECKVLIGKKTYNKCQFGAISVAADDPNSVNLSVVGDFGQLQFIINGANTPVSVVTGLIVVKNPGLTREDPDFGTTYWAEDGGITQGRCQFIPITKSSSSRCVVSLNNGDKVDVYYSTKNLRPMRTQQRL